MTIKSKKLVSLGLVFALLMLCPFVDAKERRGASIKITNKDGGRLEGELIAVKPDSLLLLSPDGKDVSADIAGIDTVEIKKKSKFWPGLLIGGAAGATAGLIGYAADRDDIFRVLMLIYVVPIFTAVGAAVGGLTGLLLSQPETIKISGASETEIAAAMEKLRKHARIPDFR